MTQKRTFRAGGRPGERLRPAVSFSGIYTLVADVSEFQPDVADSVYLAWSKAIIIRAMYGDAHVDHAWYDGERRGALHDGGAEFLGIYQYLVSGQDGGAQAVALDNLLGGLQPGEVIIADFEEGQKAMLTAWYNTMLALGYPVKQLWTYTGEDFGEEQGVLPVQFIAAYQSTEPGTPHTLWQFTDFFTVPGVGATDCSVFHGSIAQLAALAYQAAPVPDGGWTFDVVRNVTVIAGKTSARFDFFSPAGYVGTPPVPQPGVAKYELAISEGGPLAANIATYPRYLAKGQGSEESWQEGGLLPGHPYTYGLRAMLEDGSHSSTWVIGSFTT